jgi:hypothetical protein
MADTKPKPHVKLAGTLVLLGMSLFMLERFGLDWMTGPTHTPVHLDGTVLSILVIAPVVLVIGGCVVFAVGSMLRPR